MYIIIYVDVYIYIKAQIKEKYFQEIHVHLKKENKLSSFDV